MSVCMCMLFSSPFSLSLQADAATAATPAPSQPSGQDSEESEEETGQRRGTFSRILWCVRVCMCMCARMCVCSVRAWVACSFMFQSEWVS
jgi:hypothetical protein